MSKILLVATEKPFAKEAVDGIKQVCSEASYDVKLLEKYTDKKELLGAIENADALIIRSDKVDAEVLNASKKLKIVVRAGAGYDNVDLSTASKKNIVVMNTPGQNANAVAELAIGMMVYMARNKFNGKAGTELQNKTLGIHAYGNVGKLVAKIAKGFGMKIQAYDPFIKSSEIEKDNVKALSSEEDLYSNSNYISLHIPANDKTKQSINYKLLSKMPKEATLVNTARKEVINEKDLKTILSENKNFSYASDIAPDSANELTEKFNDQVYFTPKKMGAQTKEANINAGIAAAKQIVAYFEKGNTTFQVNK